MQRTVAPGDWRKQPGLIGLQRKGLNAANEDKYVREYFIKYFVQEGSVPWQERMAT